jgi:hypothetical protein
MLHDVAWLDGTQWIKIWGLGGQVYARWEGELSVVRHLETESHYVAIVESFRATSVPRVLGVELRH